MNETGFPIDKLNRKVELVQERAQRMGYTTSVAFHRPRRSEIQAAVTVDASNHLYKTVITYTLKVAKHRGVAVVSHVGTRRSSKHDPKQITKIKNMAETWRWLDALAPSNRKASR